MMGTSIIIPCWLLPHNSESLVRLTRACIRSIREHLGGCELVLIDNGSSVGSDMLQREADIYIRNETNQGYAPAVNQGLRAAHGDWLVVVNNDAEFIDDWTKQAINAWDDMTGIVCARKISDDPDRKLKQGVHQVHWFFGALWMIRRSTMEEVGYLDEEYRMALFEDLDYVMRILGRGKHMKVIGHCKHVGGASRVYLEGDQNAERQNRARFVHKWRSLWPDPSFQ